MNWWISHEKHDFTLDLCEFCESRANPMPARVCGLRKPANFCESRRNFTQFQPLWHRKPVDDTPPPGVGQPLEWAAIFREILMTQPVNPNLHPIWHDILGIKSVQVPAANAESNAAANYLMSQACTPMATTVAAPMAATVAAPTTHVSQDWQINSANPVAGRPVGIKRQVGPNLFISTTVHPGDPRYPRFSTQHNPSPINL